MLYIAVDTVIMLLQAKILLDSKKVEMIFQQPGACFLKVLIINLPDNKWARKSLAFDFIGFGHKSYPDFREKGPS